MSANSLGKVFSVTSFGESHGRVIGTLIDGCPAGLPLGEADLQPDLERRRPGRSAVSTPRNEADQAEILAGVFNGHTTGAPLCLVVHNQDTDSSKYEALKNTPRPGHADYVSYIKYGGYGDYRGGGRFSGRITAGLVMAGVVAKKLLSGAGVEITAYTVAIGGIEADAASYKDYKGAPANEVNCPDEAAAARMIEAIRRARQDGDSLGGVIEVKALGVPPGWGEPVADTLDGELAKAFFAIPAVKGVEFGAGFKSVAMRGSQNNDPFVMEGGQVAAATNNAGGILGGISSGMPVVARLAVKPTPSIGREQKTVDLDSMSEATIKIEGRHDPCIVPRAVVVAEAVMAIVLCDFGLRAGAIKGVI
jgi:chorismate synthase